VTAVLLTRSLSNAFAEEAFKVKAPAERTHAEQQDGGIASRQIWAWKHDRPCCQANCWWLEWKPGNWPRMGGKTGKRWWPSGNPKM